MEQKEFKTRLGYDETFRLSTISLQVVKYNVIMPRIEQLLRDRINPILGRQ